MNDIIRFQFLKDGVAPDCCGTVLHKPGDQCACGLIRLQSINLNGLTPSLSVVVGRWEDIPITFSVTTHPHTH